MTEIIVKLDGREIGKINAWSEITYSYPNKVKLVGVFREMDIDWYELLTEGKHKIDIEDYRNKFLYTNCHVTSASILPFTELSKIVFETKKPKKLNPKKENGLEL